MQLIDVANGKRVKVKGFLGGGNLEMKLRQLGVVPGDDALVLRHAPFGGPLLIEIRGRAIALGKGIASKIEVEDEPCVLS